MLNQLTVHLHKPCLKVYHQLSLKSWEICSQQHRRKPLIFWKTCSSSIQINDSRLSKLCSIHMFNNSIIPRRNQCAPRKSSFQLMTTKSSPSRSIVTSSILISINARKKWERRSWLNIKLTISRWVEDNLEATVPAASNMPSHLAPNSNSSMLNSNNSTNNNNTNSSNSIDNQANSSSNNTTNSNNISSSSICEINVVGLKLAEIKHIYFYFKLILNIYGKHTYLFIFLDKTVN